MAHLSLGKGSFCHIPLLGDSLMYSAELVAEESIVVGWEELPRSTHRCGNAAPCLLYAMLVGE
jgi:hypothetical protein